MSAQTIKVYKGDAQNPVFVLADADSIVFVENEPPAPLEGVFSVSETQKIRFAPGNLQCLPAEKKWRFAANQSETLGDANANCSMEYKGWIDLFGWSSDKNYYGISNSAIPREYLGNFQDWGNAMKGNWRTLTFEEWTYLEQQRNKAEELKGNACVNGINGIILLPDDWIGVEGVTFKSGHGYSPSAEEFAKQNTFTIEEWNKLETAGAVFLPTGGIRKGTEITVYNEKGYYWTSTKKGHPDAYEYEVYGDGDGCNSRRRFWGSSVHLVQNL